MLEAVKNKYSQLNQKVLKITKMKYFNELYAGLLAVITILGWNFSSNAGMIVMILLAISALLLTRDLKYVIPHCIYFIFLFSDAFTPEAMPIPVIVFGGIFAIVILVYSFKDGIHLKKMKSLLGLVGLAITTILPLIWCKIPEGNEVYYFLYFGNLGYLLLYMIMTNGIKENGTNLLAVTMSYLAIILACECALKVYSLRDEYESILQMWYYLGWGLCNEAGIMICLSIPFVFYLLGKQENLRGMIFQNFKIIIAIVGIVLTTSRGSYIFGLLEVGILYLVLLFTAKKARLYQNAFLVYSIGIIIVVLCLKSPITDLLEKILHMVFTDKLDDNGRLELWKEGLERWRKGPLTLILGSGMTCYIQYSHTQIGFVPAPIVFHSTILESLVAGGIVGLIFMVILIVQKYRNLKKMDSLMFLCVGIGFFIVDLYGLIDNTYHMYYFMLPLMVIMSTVDTSSIALIKELETK
ncbi:MAG: O-antigen ligase family protein [Anaeroplasmataceae bacterium]|nr:O-antigen ligase family protein [Anaeroplasmataceae bacterium]